MLLILSVSLVAGCASSKSAQEKDSKAVASEASADEEGGDLKPYSKVITNKAKTDEGLFSVHKIDDKFYYEIPDSLMEKEMLLVSRIAKTENEIGYGGEKLNTQVVRWQKKKKCCCAMFRTKMLPAIPRSPFIKPFAIPTSSLLSLRST